jgi:hypothetical protein
MLPLSGDQQSQYNFSPPFRNCDIKLYLSLPEREREREREKFIDNQIDD